MKIVLECITKKYARFSGRASRKEFWLFVLTFLFASFCLVGIEKIFHPVLFKIFNFLVAATFVIPLVAVAIRRLHDTDRSGGWFFIRLIPIIGEIWFLVLLCLRGSKGENSYGVDSLSTPAR